MLTENLLRPFPVLRKGLRDGMVNLPSGRWAITPAEFFLVWRDGWGAVGCFYNSSWEKSNPFQKCHVEVEETIWQASKMMTSHNFHVFTVSTCRFAFYCWED